jgi:hypothetical protein
MTKAEIANKIDEAVLCLCGYGPEYIAGEPRSRSGQGELAAYKLGQLVAQIRKGLSQEADKAPRTPI